MKDKKILLFLVSLVTISLTSCTSMKWSWWSEENINIVRGISLVDAQAVVSDASTNYDYFNSRRISYSYQTFYRDYLGTFSSEVDANILISSLAEAHRYPNEVTHEVIDYTEERNYLTAHQVSTYTSNIYLEGENNTYLEETIVNDYGYGDLEITINNFTLDESTYSSRIALGYIIQQNNINWDSSTYGFASNDQIIIEEYSTSTEGTFRIAFTNQTVPTLTNSYTMYRYLPFIDENNETHYTLDYMIEREQILTGYGIFGEEPLDAPVLLSSEERVTSLSNENLGNFNKEEIPSN